MPSNKIFRLHGKRSCNEKLFRAIQKENSKKVIKLLEKGTCPNEKQTIILATTENCTKDYLCHTDCINEHSKHEYEITSLYYALWMKLDLYAINLLISHGGDVNHKNKHGETLLHIAIIQKQFEIVHFLLAKGAKVNYTCNQKHTPLQMAVKFGYKEIAQILLEYDADMNTKCDSKFSPLTDAILNGDLEMVKLLLKYNPDLNLDCNCWFPLHYAVDGGNENIVEALLQNGAYVNCVTFDDFDLTPLLLAAADDNIKIIKSLVSRGANINAPNSSGFTSLFFVKSEETVSFLLKHGANINYNDNEQKCTPLHYAVDNEDTKKSTVLLKYEANIDILDREDCTPLSIAASLENEDLVHLLLDYSPKIILEKEYQSPFHFAADNGNLNILNMLLEHYSDILIDNFKYCGITPLISAIRKGNVHIVQRLIEIGADVNLKIVINSNTICPLKEAYEVNNKEVVDLLLKYGAVDDAVQNIS